MHEFKTYHPIVNFIYFLFVIGFSCFFMHPVCLAVSLGSGFVYSVMLKGRRAIKTNILYMLPMLLWMALINPLFNHEGATVLAHLPSGNPITRESILYGLCAASMLASVICHFSSYNEVMTSDKFLYLFGKIIPGLSLILSMTLRFVPRFLSQCKVVAEAQRTAGRDITSGNILRRIKSGIVILSGVTTWALEHAIDTADSMKARGYGLPHRTAFSIYTFAPRDRKALVSILLLGTYTLFGSLRGGMWFRYFPSPRGAELSLFSTSVFLAYLLLCIYPMILEIREVRRWKALQSKM